jgi:hypothetical protein
MMVKDQKVANSGYNLHGTIWRVTNWVRPKKQSSWFGEPQCKLGSNTGSNSRILFASYESKLVPKNLDPGLHLKWALEVAQTDLAVSTKLACFIAGSCVLASCHQQEFQEEQVLVYGHLAINRSFRKSSRPRFLPGFFKLRVSTYLSAQSEQ